MAYNKTYKHPNGSIHNAHILFNIKRNICYVYDISKNCKKHLFRVFVAIFISTLAPTFPLKAQPNNQNNQTSQNNKTNQTNKNIKNTEKQNILKIATSTNVGVLNPQGYGTNQMFAQNMVYEGLVKTDENGNIIPSLATSWEIKNNGKSYVFYLRKNVLFSNGEAFNAGAAKKNLDSVMKNKKRHSWSELALLIKRTNVINDFCIELVLKRPYAPALAELGLIRPFRFIAPSEIPNDLDLIANNPANCDALQRRSPAII